MVAMTRQPMDMKERLPRYSVELLVIAVLLFIGWRLARPLVEGTATAAAEQRVVKALREIHRAQERAVSRNLSRFRWLPEVVADAGADSVLKYFKPVADAPKGVDVLRGEGYLIALFLTDPGAPDERAWSKANAISPDVGKGGYSAFAWPEHYGERTQWAFNVDQRGTLLGEWNHGGHLDGFSDPFPPDLKPLADYLRGIKEKDKKSDWVKFLSLAELEPPAAKK